MKLIRDEFAYREQLHESPKDVPQRLYADCALSRDFHFVPTVGNCALLRLGKQAISPLSSQKQDPWEGWCWADTLISRRSAQKRAEAQALGRTPLPVSPFLTLSLDDPNFRAVTYPLSTGSAAIRRTILAKSPLGGSLPAARIS